MMYFTLEVFRRLANQNHGHIHVMLEFEFSPLCFSHSVNNWSLIHALEPGSKISIS